MYRAPEGYTPELCIYHHPCADGFTAAWAIQLRWPDCEMQPGKYQADSLPDVAGKHVLLVDFSYKPDDLMQIVSEAASVTILDHHESAQRLLEPMIEDGTIKGVFDMTKSGAALAWEFAYGDDVTAFTRSFGVTESDRLPDLVRYIQDRDLWTWELPSSKEISAWLGLTPMTFKAWSDAAVRLSMVETFDIAVDIGRALCKKFDSDLAGAIKASKRRMTIGGYDVPVANLPYIYASEGGNIMSKGEPFAAIYFDAADGSRSFSLRSDKDDPSAVNVSLVAGEFGGGGHKNAAGFRAPSGWEGDVN
ncbi:single-stranded-DNA-specific exonuclease [Brevundimonas phage vB_BpoS-Gurke]|uniref:Single-stranded-DNA-specific exonuclease n=1 Tax=Brevundimonas phage vB_BpoS-Gurke TaxID=2948599 RepID=A0A9E7N597_9CAUD|nr:single-stranded-DNA-specific exonuclease [Brevundimonas phage vB_BpoS-Gurke]